MSMAGFKEYSEEIILKQRQDNLLIEEKELLRLRKVWRGPHKWHEQRMYAEDKFNDFVKQFNVKVRQLNKDIDNHNEKWS